MVGGTLRTTTNFFLGHRVKTTMSTNMTQVRSILPARLRGARFATIARDPAFRRYFASGDDSATIRGVLKQFYGAAGNTKRSAALDRQLAREARSRRALVGARQRRHRAQNVAQALAPVVQAADSRAQRLANRKARARAFNLLRRRQLAFRAARNPSGCRPCCPIPKHAKSSRVRHWASCIVQRWTASSCDRLLPISADAVAYRRHQYLHTVRFLCIQCN